MHSERYRGHHEERPEEQTDHLRPVRYPPARKHYLTTVLVWLLFFLIVVIVLTALWGIMQIGV
jgi:hypothetical protein